jgi:hypothetical protein
MQKKIASTTMLNVDLQHLFINKTVSADQEHDLLCWQEIGLGEAKKFIQSTYCGHITSSIQTTEIENILGWSQEASNKFC